MNYLNLIKDTGAYRIVQSDKKSESLSHAYLIVTPDKTVSEYLKVIAKLILCGSDNPCNTCRTCSLIDNNMHPDVITYPTDGESVKTDDVTDLIEQSYIKPLEAKYKIFIINNAETMNAVSQNKLLKTLEEPPKNVIILIGALNEFNILQTVKSRVKKLEIPSIPEDLILKELREECDDYDKLLSAVNSGDGTVSRAKELYFDENLKEVKDLIAETLNGMQSSRDVLRFALKWDKIKEDFTSVLGCFELVFRDMLLYYQGSESLVKDKETFNKVKNAEGYNAGAVLFALESIFQAEKRKKFNSSDKIVLEWLLFQILEGKFKWRK